MALKVALLPMGGCSPEGMSSRFHSDGVNDELAGGGGRIPIAVNHLNLDVMGSGLPGTDEGELFVLACPSLTSYLMRRAAPSAGCEEIHDLSQLNMNGHCHNSVSPGVVSIAFLFSALISLSIQASLLRLASSCKWIRSRNGHTPDSSFMK